MKLIPAPVLPPLPSAEYADLRDSIREIGVQVPLMVAASGEIIDGHERFRAITELRLRRYPLRVVGGLSEGERRELAITINLKRRHLTTQQRREIIEAELKHNPARTDRALAEVLRVDHKTIGTARRRLEGNGEIPRLAKVARNGKVFKPAIGVETSAGATEAGRLLRELDASEVRGGLTLRDARKAAWQQRFDNDALSPSARLPSCIQIRQSDFRDLEVAPGTVDLILTDPPWSIQETMHEDMGKTFFRWLKPGGLVLCYVGNQSLPLFLDGFRSGGLTYQWLLGATRFPPYAGLRRRGGKMNASLRPILLFSKGDAFHVHKTPADLIYSRDPVERTHPQNWQQPLDESRYLIAHFSRPGTMIVDPFCGSGTTAVATLLEGQGRKYLGCDVDPSCVRIARDRVATKAEA